METTTTEPGPRAVVASNKSTTSLSCSCSSPSTSRLWWCSQCTSTCLLLLSRSEARVESITRCAKLRHESLTRTKAIRVAAWVVPAPPPLQSSLACYSPTDTPSTSCSSVRISVKVDIAWSRTAWSSPPAPARLRTMGKCLCPSEESTTSTTSSSRSRSSRTSAHSKHRSWARTVASLPHCRSEPKPKSKSQRRPSG